MATGERMSINKLLVSRMRSFHIRRKKEKKPLAVHGTLHIKPTERRLYCRSEYPVHNCRKGSETHSN
ncbi:hypothetical protein NC653_034126 [Populus alba x Populus x berolinensis]|uniref:Uncharacterized protein n=1 Tax=Populus alba x Populus x berolinensis TaxID=444605 RepID=A0AAD6PVN7_9ROSI|nr:hypothetical protein NC653_034126 [Populus alba x Populus x berolinensis]